MVGCSSSGSKDGSGTPAGTAAESARYTVPEPEVTTPSAEGNGINVVQPAAPLPDGYTQQEFFIGGTATSFKPVATPSNGFWSATPGKTAPYKTRVIVRTPPADKFSGNVVVEWYNVSALEAGPDWAYISQTIGRNGDAYVGVSAQVQGVEGGKTIIDVEPDPDAVAKFGKTGNIDKSGLKHIDPVRYGTLVHPGDVYSFDMFAQVGKAVKDSPTLLGGLKAKHVIATGQSQSATFLTTFVDALQPLDPVYDGFIIHSRGAGAAPLDRAYKGADTVILNGKSVLIRTDLEQPVLMFETESDMTLLGQSAARQPDTKRIRTWEVAGTAHADAHLISVITGGPRDPGVGSLLGCTSVNTGPHHEVLSAAYHQVVGWVDGGAAPPTGKPLKLGKAKAHAITDTTVKRDANGNALGGVRNPLLDVPVFALSGEAPAGATAADVFKKNGTCLLFGSTTPFDQAKLVDLYGTADNYVAEFKKSAEKAVAAGFLLQPDADELIGEAEANRALFG